MEKCFSGHDIHNVVIKHIKRCGLTSSLSQLRLLRVCRSLRVRLRPKPSLNTSWQLPPFSALLTSCSIPFIERDKLEYQISKAEKICSRKHELIWMETQMYELTSVRSGNSGVSSKTFGSSLILAKGTSFSNGTRTRTSTSGLRLLSCERRYNQAKAASNVFKKMVFINLFQLLVTIDVTQTLPQESDEIFIKRKLKITWSIYFIPPTL